GAVTEPPRLKDPQTRFLREVRARATHVLRRASWAEVQRGLADLGLSLRVKGGGFVLTDGEREVKASKVGREFSRFYMEGRLGLYPDPVMPAATPDTPTPPVTVEPAKSQPTPAPAPPVTPEPRSPAIASPAIAPPPAEVRPRSKARQDIRAEQHELPFADSPTPPAPVHPPSHPASARPEPQAQRPAERAPRPPEPVRADPPRALHPRPVEPAAPAPLLPPTPDLPSPLRDLVQQCAAVEEAERKIDEAGADLDAAKHALEMLREGADGLTMARDSATERLREVYADPEAALKAMTEYWLERDNQALLSAVNATPEQFGALRLERDPRPFGIFFRKDTTRAKQAVPLLADALKHYYATLASSSEERSAAWRKLYDARSALEAAQQARSALPPGHSSSYRRELADVLRSAAGGADDLARLITTTIPTAARFVAGALDAVHDEERRRERKRGPGLGIDL
ncbi:MAG TPA: BID domain-containing protein, partial [Thermoanaerobaculia bacterium]